MLARRASKSVTLCVNPLHGWFQQGHQNEADLLGGPLSFDYCCRPDLSERSDFVCFQCYFQGQLKYAAASGFKGSGQMARVFLKFSQPQLLIFLTQFGGPSKFAKLFPQPCKGTGIRYLFDARAVML